MSKLFGKRKKGEGDAPDEAAEATNGRAFTPNPAKARPWFEHARTAHDGRNFEYAMTLWLKGLGQDPTSMDALESFVRSSLLFVEQNPKAKGPTKGQAKNFTGRGPVEKYLGDLLGWGAKGLDWQAGLKALGGAVKLDLPEAAYWIGQKVIAMAAPDPKAKKDSFVDMMNLLAKVGAFDLAVKAGEFAVNRDPTDSRLAAEVRNLSAQATMSSGGYEESGAVGGFRSNIRDLDKQRVMEAEDQIVKSASKQEQLIELAMADYKERPTDRGAIEKIARLLLERGEAKDEGAAYEILMQGFKDTSNYRFRQKAGEIKIRVARRKLRQIEEQAAAAPDDAEARGKADAARRQMLELEVKEYTEQVANYPTDMKIKYELGRRHFELGNFEPAIEQFQIAQGAAGIGDRAMHYLGRAFLAMSWLDEAERTFRKAIDARESEKDELAMELRYWLMRTLEQKAADTNDERAADEAFQLASGLAIQQINYRDIRARREAIQGLLKSLRA